MKRIIATLLLLLSQQLFCQSFHAFDVNPGNFPEINAKFWAYDIYGKNIFNLSPDDFQVWEDGIEREVISVICPAPKDPLPISSVLTIDISGSMGTRYMNIAKAGAKAWIDIMDMEISECAVTSFNEMNFLNQDFTQNKQSLIAAVDALTSDDGTAYNAALIDEKAGALLIAEKARFKKVIVLLTDGYSDCNEEQIINKAHKLNASIYCLIVNLPCPEQLKKISGQTGGKWYEQINNAEQVIEIYKEIFSLSNEFEPCEITWESGFKCTKTITNADIVMVDDSLCEHHNYMHPESAIASLKFEPPFINFLNKEVDIEHNETITVTAINADFNVSNISCQNPQFQISPPNFSISKGESKPLKLSYTPSDKEYSIANFNFINDVCPANYTATGEYEGVIPEIQTLQLTHPNGGETFVVGADTVITWEGIPAGDTVALHYSINNGQSWNLITNAATGLKYKWENIPGPASTQCLVRVQQLRNKSGDGLVPGIEWEKCFGGSREECAYSIIQNSQGNYIAAGYTGSDDGDVEEGLGSSDVWIITLDQAGDLNNLSSFGGSGGEEAKSIRKTFDGGYIIAGCTNSNDHDVANHIGGLDYWIIKYDSKGILQWEKTLGGTNYDEATDIQQTDDGGYIVCGNSSSNDHHISHNNGSRDIWVVKLSNIGLIQWEKSVGSLHGDYCNSIINTLDGGYLAAGYSDAYVYDGDSYLNGENLWLIKLNNNGNTEWVKSLGGSKDDRANSVIQSSDGNYIVAGYTWSFGGDVSRNNGYSDIWVIKVDTKGKILWEKTYGGRDREWANCIQETNDGCFVLTGRTNSRDLDFAMNEDYNSAFVIKIDNTGKLLWAKTLGGGSTEDGYSIIQTVDGGYILAGSIFSADSIPDDHHGWKDMWVVKLSPDAVILQEDISDSLFAIVAPEAVCRDIDMGSVLLGGYKDSVVNDFVHNSGSWPFDVDSIYLRGSDATAFNLVSGFPEYSVEPAAGHPSEFRFTPSRKGPYQAEIVIITQADTIIQNIYGEGVTPQLAVLEDIIDFGIVEVGYYKDTVQAATIKNIGSALLSITDTRHNKPNDIDFTTLPGGGPFTLEPGDTCKMNLRFEPGDEGRTGGVLEFHYDGTGSPAIVQLFGEGLKINPHISTIPDIFPDLICENSSQSYIDISNTGGKDLIISEMNFKGTNATEFSMNESLPLTIEADSTKRIMMYFNPSSPGDKNAALEIKSNADPDSLLTIQLNALKDSVSIEAETNVINLGYLCPGESKDTVLTLMNKGTIETGAYMELSENLDAGTLSFTSASGASFNFNFSFKGLSEEGSFNDTISITDSICSRTTQIPVTGIISLPELKVEDISISSIIGTSGEAELLIENISDREIIITGLPAISAPFEFTENPFPITLKAGKNLPLPVRYTPDDMEVDSIIIILNAEPCGIAEEIQINGVPFVASATIMAADIEAYPGEQIILPITLYAEENLSISGVSSINFDLKFNPTLLLPSDYMPVKFDDTTASIKIENLPIGQNTGATLTEILFIAGLGNAEECPLTLTNPVNNNGFAEITALPGKFKLLGICREGGSRLLNPDNQAGIVNIYPNPAEDKIYVELSITEEAQTELSIYNTMGRNVSTILSETAQTGNKTIEISTKGLGNGTYVLIFNTPTIVKSRSFSIVR